MRRIEPSLLPWVMRNVAHTAPPAPVGMGNVHILPFPAPVSERMVHIQPSLLPWVGEGVRVNVGNVLPGGRERRGYPAYASQYPR